MIVYKLMINSMPTGWRNILKFQRDERVLKEHVQYTQIHIASNVSILFKLHRNLWRFDSAQTPLSELTWPQ